MSTGNTEKVYQVPQQTLFNVILLLVVGAAIAYFGFGHTTAKPGGLFAPASECQCPYRHRNPYYPNGATGQTGDVAPPAPVVK